MAERNAVATNGRIPPQVREAAADVAGSIHTESVMFLPLRHLVAAAALALVFTAPAHAELKPTKRVEPVYPPEAARSGTTGFVEVEYTVDAAGKVANVSVLNAKPARTFETAAVKAVKQWQFPSGADGRGKVRLDFSL
jgi:protein TonB